MAERPHRHRHRHVKMYTNSAFALIPYSNMVCVSRFASKRINFDFLTQYILFIQIEGREKGESFDRRSKLGEVKTLT